MVRTLKNLKFLKIPSVGLFLGPNGSFWRVFQLLGLAAFRGKITSRFEKYTFYIGGTLSQIFFSRKIEKNRIFLGLEMDLMPLILLLMVYKRFTLCFYHVFHWFWWKITKKQNFGGKNLTISCRESAPVHHCVAAIPLVTPSTKISPSSPVEPTMMSLSSGKWSLAAWTSWSNTMFPSMIGS